MENVYSQVKMFHFRDKLAALANKEISAPIHVRLKPTNRCNHRCFYCCYRNEKLFLNQLFNEHDAIPQAKMAEIVRDIISSGVKAVTFSGGGEPLIYPHIVETAEALLAGGVKVATLTNGSALRGDVAQVLAAGASWVRISIDGADAEGLRQSRGVAEEEFAKIITNIEAFAHQKHSHCELGINFIITQLNWRKTYDFLRLMRDKGANHVKISECIVSTNGDENNNYHQDYFNQIKEEIARASADLNSDNFRIIDKFHDFDDKFAKKYHWCPFINFLNVIAADQTVYSCQDKAYTHKGILGSLKEQSLTDLWRSKAYKEALLAIDPQQDCNHHCVSHGKNISLLDYLTTDPDHLEFV